MPTEQIKKFDQINKLYEKASHLTSDYWVSYSGFNTWQFWFLLGLTLLPLVALYFLLDRTKAFQIGFYGFSFHMLFHYVDTYGFTNRLWGYPFKLIPFLPTSIALDTSFVPVSFMFVYQWTLNKQKNYYLYAGALSFFLSFLFKPAMAAFGLIQLYKGVNYFHLFVLYIVMMVVAKILTNVFAHFQGEAQEINKQSVKTASTITLRIINKPAKPIEKKSLLSRLFHREKAR